MTERGHLVLFRLQLPEGTAPALSRYPGARHGSNSPFPLNASGTNGPRKGQTFRPLAMALLVTAPCPGHSHLDHWVSWLLNNTSYFVETNNLAETSYLVRASYWLGLRTQLRLVNWLRLVPV